MRGELLPEDAFGESAIGLETCDLREFLRFSESTAA